MMERIIEVQPERSLDLITILAIIEKNIKSEIDRVKGKVTVEDVKNIILNAISNIESFEDAKLVKYQIDDKTIRTVNYTEVINKFKATFNETVAAIDLSPNSSNELSTIIKKMIEYKDLSPNEISENRSYGWDQLVQPELNNYFRAYLTNIMYDPTMGYTESISTAISETKKRSKYASLNTITAPLGKLIRNESLAYRIENSKMQLIGILILFIIGLCGILYADKYFSSKKQHQAAQTNNDNGL